MKTKLPTKITTVDEAKAFLEDLYNNDEHFHPDDDPSTVGLYVGEEWQYLFNKEEAAAIDKLMGQISDLEGFCPCEVLLMLSGHQY